MHALPQIVGPNWILRGPALLALGLGLSGCALPFQQTNLPGPLTTSSVDRSTSPKGVATSDKADPAARYPTVWTGSGRLVGTSGTEPPPAPAQSTAPRGRAGTDPVTLNFAGASIAEVSRAVLGDILGLNYSVSDGLKGSITLQTPNPVPRDQVLPALESVLKAEGAAIVVENGLHRVVPIAEAGAGRLRQASARRSGEVGISSEVIALRHVVPEDMQRLITGMAPGSIKLVADANRNVLIVTGTASDIAAARELISVFDVDWMRGTSFGIYPVEAGDPEAIAQELDTVFANDRSSPTKGLVRFIPNKRLKSILIISSRAEYLKRAERWLKRLDLVGQESEKQVHVYRVLHRPAGELAALLQRVYTPAAARQQQAARAGLPPGTQPATIATEPEPQTSLTGSRPVAGPQPLATPIVGSVAAPLPPGGGTGAAVPAQVQLLEQAAQALPQAVQPGTQRAPDDRASGIEIFADEANNALIITATPREFKRVRQVLSRVDVAPAQVLLEATIAEVTLNDKLQFGLRWFFQNGKHSTKFTDSAIGAVLPKFPGFSHFINAPNVQVAINALS
ncbi:MAG: hypothetical protein RL291_204, partial [Pseudomonadota bacterium]